MAHKPLVLRFGRGGCVQADWLEEAAPSTCEAVRRALPINGRLEHAMFCGQVILTFVDFKVPAVENAHVYGLRPGDIVFSTHPSPLVFPDNNPVPCEILVVYDHKTVIWDWAGTAPVNLFARVRNEDLALLKTVAERIREMGREQVQLTLGGQNEGGGTIIEQ